MFALRNPRAFRLRKRLDPIDGSEHSVHERADLAQLVPLEMEAQGLRQLLEFTRGESSNRQGGAPVAKSQGVSRGVRIRPSWVIEVMWVPSRVYMEP